MKTTLQLPDELMRAVKIRAAEQNRKLTDVVTELLRRGLAADTTPSQPVGNRVKFPLITGTHPAKPGQEVTPQRAFEILMDEEEERARHA